MAGGGSNIEWSSKKLWNMIRTGGCISYKFFKEDLQKFQYNVKRACIFYLLLVGIPSSLILLVKKNSGLTKFNWLTKSVHFNFANWIFIYKLQLKQDLNNRFLKLFGVKNSGNYNLVSLSWRYIQILIEYF